MNNDTKLRGNNIDTTRLEDTGLNRMNPMSKDEMTWIGDGESTATGSILPALIHFSQVEPSLLLNYIAANGVDIEKQIILGYSQTTVIIIITSTQFQCEADVLFRDYLSLRMARMSPSLNNVSSSASSLTAVPPYSGNKTRSPGLTAGSMSCPFSRLPGPTAMTVPSGIRDC